MPRPLINDKFTSLPVSRQRKWALRRKEEKRCMICGERAVNKTHCTVHRQYIDERQNRIYNSKKKKATDVVEEKGTKNEKDK